MQRYTEQLIERLKAAKNNLPEPPDYKALYPNHPAWDYGLGYIVEMENGVEYTPEELTSIKWNEFPPVEKLTLLQTKQLVEAIELFLQECQTYIPKPIPEDEYEILYTAIVRFWKDEIPSIPCLSNKDTRCGLTLCNLNIKDCVWTSVYCECKELMELDEQKGKQVTLIKPLNQKNASSDDLPF